MKLYCLHLYIGRSRLMLPNHRAQDLESPPDIQKSGMTQRAGSRYYLKVWLDSIFPHPLQSKKQLSLPYSCRKWLDMDPEKWVVEASESETIGKGECGVEAPNWWEKEYMKVCRMHDEASPAPHSLPMTSHLPPPSSRDTSGQKD